MALGPYAAYIEGSWLIVTVVVAGLIGWLVHDGRQQAAALAALDARGIKRRSAE